LLCKQDSELRCVLTRQPPLHRRKVGSGLRLAVLDHLDGAAAEHGDGLAGRAANGLLASRDDAVKTPFVKGKLLAGDTADAIDDDEGLRGHLLDGSGDALDVAQDTGGGVDVRHGEDLVLLLLEGLLDVRDLRPPANGPVELGDVGAVGAQAVGEAVAKVAGAQDKGILTGLDEVDGDEVPAEGARAVDDEGLRRGVGRLEELAQQGEGLAKGGDEAGSDVALAVNPQSARCEVWEQPVHSQRTCSGPWTGGRHRQTRWAPG